MPLFHQLEPGELGAFCDGADGGAALRERLARSLESGSVRPEWCWKATGPDGAVLARHYWWGAPGSGTPTVFKNVSAEDPGAAASLLAHARDLIGVQEAWCEVTAPVETGQNPSVARADLVALLTRAGFGFAVGRVGVEWAPGAGVRPGAGALEMRPASEFGDEDLVALFRAVGDGSADHGMIADRKRLGPDQEARKRLASARAFRGEPGWFAVGVTPAGGLAGYVVPAWGTAAASVAELGVASPHRGRGYARELLAHATALLAAAGADRIGADTDLANIRMRAAFARAGYREVRRRDDYRWRRAERGRPGRRGPGIAALHAEPPVLETTRLRLTPLAVGDAAEMVDVLSDPGLYRFTGGLPPTFAELERQYEYQTAGRSPDGAQIWRNWIVRRAADGAAVGFAQATVSADGSLAEVAWVVGAGHQGGGYASEAATAVVGWLARVGARDVLAHIHPGNLASQIVARRAGLAPTGVMREGEVRWRRSLAPPAEG